jgi:hypothetical protein
MIKHGRCRFISAARRVAGFPFILFVACAAAEICIFNTQKGGVGDKSEREMAPSVDTN